MEERIDAENEVRRQVIGPLMEQGREGRHLESTRDRKNQTDREEGRTENKEVNRGRTPSGRMRSEVTRQE